MRHEALLVDLASARNEVFAAVGKGEIAVTAVVQANTSGPGCVSGNDLVESSLLLGHHARLRDGGSEDDIRIARRLLEVPLVVDHRPANEDALRIRFGQVEKMAHFPLGV